MNIPTLTERNLQKEVDELYFQLKKKTSDFVELEKQFKKLQRKNTSQIKLTSKYRLENSRLREKYGVKLPSRCERVRETLIKREQGLDKRPLKLIAAEFFLSYETIKSLARDLRKNNI